jgi:signal recognition particle subunit SRP54
MTGQESLKVASSFNDFIGFQSAILTKMDSEARAGAALAFYHTLKKPIIFIGTGEKVADLEFFRPERVASRILGMGDIMTLLERAEEKIKQAEQEDMYRSLQKGKLTLQDFADQLSMVSKLGSLSQVMKYFPGASNVSPEMLEKGEQDLKKFRAIISSMNQKERLFPSILDASRKKRIAQGAGVTVADINMLLERFEQSQQFVKLLKKFERFNKMF